jgi:hypothetical protein
MKNETTKKDNLIEDKYRQRACMKQERAFVYTYRESSTTTSDNNNQQHQN